MIKNKFVISLVSLFLICSFASGQIKSSSAPQDTLKIAYKEILANDSYKSEKVNRKTKLIVGTALMVSCGVLSYYCHKQADNYYSQYLHSGSISQMNNKFFLTEKYDRYKGMMTIGIEIGFLINVWAFL